MDCVFCKIARSEIKTEFAYEDSEVIAFNDIKPQAPIHVIVIPRKHIEKPDDLNKDSSNIMQKLYNAALKIVELKKLTINGYRLVLNCGKDAGQEVAHVHMHILGGRKFAWPPG